MFGKIKSTLGKVKKAATSTLGKVASSLGASTISAVNTITSGGSGNFNLAPIPKGSPNSPTLNQTLVPNQTLLGGGLGATAPSGQTVVYNPGGTVNQLRTIQANSGSIGGGSYNSGTSPIYSAPITLGGGQTRTLGGSTLGTTSGTTDFGTMSLASSGGGVIGSQSLASSPSISLPSAPSYANPGQINNGGLIGALADTQQYDPNTNSFVPIVQTEDPQQAGRIKLEDMLRDIIPQKENVFEDPDVRRQQAEVNQRKQEVANYTSQLNSVVAQQNADLLRLRGIGAQEGVTETVYGGQAATINREAAIKALPIQAQIAAAQGSLELAQDYLTQLTTWKQEALDNDYTYRKDVYNSVRSFMDKEEKRQLDKIEKADDRAYQEGRDLIADQDYWVKEAVKNGQASLIPRINNTRSRQELATVVSGMKPKDTDASGNSTKPLSILDVSRYQELYPEAGVEAGDSEVTANAKVAKLSTPEGQTRSLITAAKANGNDYETVVEEIESDTSIRDKNTALKIANEVFNRPSITPSKDLESGVSSLMNQLDSFLFSK